MKYFVAKFKVQVKSELMQPCRELIADGAAQAGFESFEETPDGVNGYVQDALFNKKALDELILNFHIGEARIDYTLENIDNKDWNESWESCGFSPIMIDNNILVFDARHTTSNKILATLPHFDNLISIGIEPHQAFGTGTHETTQMMISSLLSLQQKDRQVLDCGCGTGILGIAAKKLGARRVVGYDIDEWSVENTRRNAQLNGIDDFDVHLGNIHVLTHIPGVFDVVLANINRNTLLADMPLMRSVMNKCGWLIISGFYTKDVDILEEQAGRLGLHRSALKTNDSWACLTLH